MAQKGSVNREAVDKLPPQTIIGLHAENVMRIGLVDLKPDATGAIVIGGQNEAGKSSLINSIMFALGGASSMPERPVREGRKESVVELHTQSLNIRRLIKPDGSTRVEVTGKDGLGLGTGQAVLDCLFTDLTFDPLAFLRMKPAEQVEALRSMTGLDFTALESKRAELYEKRRLANADHDRVKARLASIPEFPKDTPAAEQSMSALAAEVEKAQQLHSLRADILRKAGELRNGLVRFLPACIELAGAKIKLPDADIVPALDKMAQALPMGPDPDKARAALASAEATNRHVRNKLEAAKLKEEADKLERQSKNLTYEIDEIDAEKDKRTKAATLPVDGLAFDNARLLYKGLPFEQASYAVKLKVSFSMAMAMNPKLRICLIRDGAMLDDKNRAALIEMAKEAKAQVWLEIVGEKGATVIMEDGAVKAGR